VDHLYYILLSHSFIFLTVMVSFHANRPSLVTIVAHPFFTHDPKKIPRSLPSCCTHVAPDWQEDRDGYLVPILAEADEETQWSSKPSSRRKEVPDSSSRQSQQAVRNSNNYPTEQLSREKENDAPSRKPASQFEIYSEKPSRPQSNPRSEYPISSSSSRVKSADREIRQSNDTDFTAPTSNRELISDDVLAEKLTACAIQDSPAGEGLVREADEKATSDADANALETMYSRLKDLGDRVEASGPTTFRPASPIQVAGAEKWVTRYVDYTSKYGLGFLFNDGR